MIAPGRISRILLLPLAILFLAGCTGLPGAIATTDTPVVANTVTPTIVWFPATTTPTIFPTVAPMPTAELRPGLADLLVDDQFEDASAWMTSSGENTSVVVDRGRITLTARPKFLVYSLRDQPVMTDFYMEINARLNLCHAGDVYGLIFRATSNLDYYRFAVNCNGQVRAERVHNGQMVPLHDWQSSGDAPAGAPGEVKLGVWASGEELRFFLNDRYQFTARDPLFPYGSSGVYILAGNATDETVSFSNLKLTMVSYNVPDPSPIPAPSSVVTRTP
jgi:hypothetical protein